MCRRCRFLLVLGCALHAIAVSCAAQVEGERVPDVKTLIAAHEQGLGLIHSIDLKMATYGRDYIGPLVEQGETHISSIRWSRRGDLERIRAKRHEGKTTRNGRPTNLVDVMLTPTELRMLRNWDPENPQKISITDQGTVRGYAAVRTASVGSHDPGHVLLLTFSVGGVGKPRRTLRELVRLGSGAVVKKARIDAADVWRIRLFHPGRDGAPASEGSYLDVFLDPNAGYLCRRFVEHLASREIYDFKTKKRRTVSTEQVTTVDGFDDLGDGVFFPKSARYDFIRSDHKGPTHTGRYELTDVNINKPLPAGTFDFQFPKDVIVFNEPVGAKPKIQVYGDGEKPVKTFDNAKNLQTYIDAHAPPSGMGDGWAGYLKIACVVLTILLIAFVFLQRRRGTKAV